MIAFNPLRTKRLSVDLRELSIDDAETLCMMPDQLDQASTTEMLKRVVLTIDRPLPGQVTDPRMWTVQERTMVMAHYMAHTSEDGDPNFAVGDSGRLSDYLISGTDYIESVSLGVIDGEEIFMRPLLGFQAEIIERLVFSGRMRPNRLSWWICAMACQMTRANEMPKEYVGDADYSEWLLGTVNLFRALGEHEFLQLLYAFLDGCQKLDHFFSIVFTDSLIAAKPNKEDSSLPSARFPVDAAVRAGTLAVLGVTGQNESRFGVVLQPAT